ncbi:MAG: Rne/Rng family ribonuclease [Gammaproteobacteria bacterium]|nr:Rne/Rng family ribonuclease [Gammaproteobacteria bacterium]
MKRMLINATQSEELRVAIVDGQRLANLDIEHGTREQKKSNIYKGKITRIEPSLEAIFVDYGAERHGFLPFKEVARGYLSEEALQGGGRPDVKAGLSEGQEIIVQVEKEERGNKGAALTTFISLAGRYLVLMPNNPRAGGISRRIEGEDRAELREAMKDLQTPKGMGAIVRTAGVGKSTEDLQWDLNYQADIWEAIQRSAEEKSAPFLIYQESNVIVRAIRDYFRSDIGEILIDEANVYTQAQQFVSQTMPHNLKKVKHYTDSVPLFNRYQIESQIESVFQREVSLMSGGSVVIDHTEALISIDINSAKATKGADIEETATNTNLEAADEIARQLRLRDIGGLIVIDFIDMMKSKNQRLIENRLRDATKDDRARIQLGRISRFGLLEMSRQRLRPSLGEASQIVCPRCSGHGSIRSIESMALSVLRLVEEDSMKESTARVVAQLPVDVATFLLNEKREVVAAIEERNQVHVIIVPNPDMETPHYKLERIKSADVQSDEGKSSYQRVEVFDQPYVPEKQDTQTKVEQAAVGNILPQTPPPKREKSNNESGGLSKLIKRLFGGAKAEPEPQKVAKRPQQTRRKPQQSGSGSGSQKREESKRGNSGEGTSRSKNRGNRDNNRNNRRDRPSRSADDTSNKPSSSTDGNGHSQKKQRNGEGSNRSNRSRRSRRSPNRPARDHDQVAVSADTPSETASDSSTGLPPKAQPPKEGTVNARSASATADTSKVAAVQDRASLTPVKKEDASAQEKSTTVLESSVPKEGMTVSNVQPSQLKSSVRSLAVDNDNSEAPTKGTEDLADKSAKKETSEQKEASGLVQIETRKPPSASSEENKEERSPAKTDAVDQTKAAVSKSAPMAVESSNPAPVPESAKKPDVKASDVSPSSEFPMPKQKDKQQALVGQDKKVVSEEKVKSARSVDQLLSPSPVVAPKEARGAVDGSTVTQPKPDSKAVKERVSERQEQGSE